jgi:CBS domain containing-hemolysin-like protein
MLVALIITALLLSALFSGSEIAFVSGNKLRVELRKKRGGRRGSILAFFYDNPAAFLGTMLVGNNIALVAFTTLMERWLSPALEPAFSNEAVLLFLNTTIITLVVLVFGEFLPKTIFRLFSDQALYVLAYPIRFLQSLLAPPSWLMIQSANGLIRLLTRSPLESGEVTLTRLDLEKFVEEARPGEAEEEIDKELFGKALNLKEVRVRECMVPRPEIEHIDVAASVEELEYLFRESNLSRVLVTDGGDVDKVLGYVHHQQLLKQPRAIRPLIMNILFVPEVMRVTDLLNTFIQQSLNIAIVVDEFGGVSGLVTLEDALEEIFGEIEDEHDQEEHVELNINDTEWVFSGRLEVDYLNEKYGLHFPEGDYHTLSGMLVTTTQTIPEQGAELILNGYRFVLELVSDTKIEMVRVEQLADRAPESDHQ